VVPIFRTFIVETVFLIIGDLDFAIECTTVDDGIFLDTIKEAPYHPERDEPSDINAREQYSVLETPILEGKTLPKTCVQLHKRRFVDAWLSALPSPLLFACTVHLPIGHTAVMANADVPHSFLLGIIIFDESADLGGRSIDSGELEDVKKEHASVVQ
jgi:hypothetical protein